MSGIVKRRVTLMGKLARIEDAIDRQGEMLSKGGDRKFYSDKIENLNALHSKYKSELDNLQGLEPYKQEVISLLISLNHGVGTGIIPEQVRKIDGAVCWAWDNWDENIVSTYYSGEKPKFPTEDFINQWVENEDFEADGFDIEFLKTL